MWDSRYFAVGDWFSCEYNGKARPSCEVIEVHRDRVLVRTSDGFRNFSYHKLAKVEHTSLSAN